MARTREPVDKSLVSRFYDKHIEALFEELESARPDDQPPSEIGALLNHLNSDLQDEWREWWTTGDDEEWS